MSDDSSSTVKRLKAGRIECTVIITEEEAKPAAEKALHELGREIEVDGFRKGNVPIDVVKEKVKPDQLFEETVRNLLPDTFEKLIKEHDIKPVIHPKVEVKEAEPITLLITFVEKPDVKVKGADKIKVEKKEPKVDAKDIERMIEYILQQHTKTTEVDREAKDGDQITMDFWGENKDKKEIDGIRTTGHTVVIGSKVLIPGFEENLTGMKKGGSKDFTLTFPEKYHAEHLQNTDVTFHVAVTKIEELDKPELTDAFVKAQLGAETVSEFKKQVEESMMQQEQHMEFQRQERELLDGIANATVVELAPELLEEETRSMIEEFLQQLQQQGVTLEQWMQQAQKTAEDLHKEMSEQSEKRLRLRLGMQQLIEERNIEVTDEEMTPIVENFLSRATPEQRKEVEAAYEKGAQAYEQLKWQTKVEKMISGMLAA